MNVFYGQTTKKSRIITYNKKYFFIITLTTILLLCMRNVANAEANENFNYKYGWWSSEGYNANNITGNTVSGDFDGDGKDDIAAMYNYGTYESRIHVFKSTGNNFAYQTPNGWWKSKGYNSQSVKGRLVSGDFNGDGKDDIAGFYDYGNSQTKIHVFLSDGSKFNYQGPEGWWRAKNYDANMITGRVVSGDYNNDGKDDLAVLYDYGNSKTRIHVFLSDGSKFNYQGPEGWWAPTGYYDANMVTGRVVSGDYNNDGKDDIAALYDYGNSKTRIHVFLSDSSKFNYQGPEGWWSVGGYDSNRVTNRVVSGDYNNDGKDDIATVYDYGSSQTKVHIFLSDGSKLNYQGPEGWWSAKNYDANMITGRVVSGNFDGNAGSDIGMVYDYTNSLTKMHMLLSKSEQSGSDVVSEALYWVGKIPYYMDTIISTQKLDRNNPPPYMDCADFTSSVYYTVKNIKIGTWTGSQKHYGNAVDITAAKSGNYSKLMPGDLIFFTWPGGDYTNGDHVAIYIGNGQIVHESGTNANGGNVKINSLNENWGTGYGILKNNIIAIRRVI